MKLIIFLLFTQVAFAQDSKLIEENKQLKEENRMLREEIKKLQTQPQSPAGSAKMMEALKKGQAYQEEQNKALEELDKEED